MHVTTLTNTCNPKPSDALQSTQDLCWLKSTVKVDNKSSQQRADGLSRAKTFVSYQTGYTFVIINVDCCRFPRAGLHKLRYPGIRDMSTWSKFGAHGEHGDVFLFSNLGAL